MERILIVDDIPENLYFLEVLLKTNGYEVESASNGIQALELVRGTPPALIISDVLMPGMDGFSFCRACKSDHKLKAIPFLFYTATYTDARDETFALSLGADAFVIKPIDPDLLLDLIRKAMQDGRKKAPPANPDVVEKEEVFFKEYNEALIRKLEDKMMELQKSNKRLASLYQVSCDLHTMKPGAELIYDILLHVVASAGYKQANYFQFEESWKKLTLLASAGFSDDKLPSIKEKLIFRLGEKRGLVGHVAETGKTLNVPDTFKEPDWINVDSSTKSALFTPVIFEKKLQGVIVLLNDQVGAFSEEDEHDISILANSLGTIIENHRNQEQIKCQLTRVSALHNIDLVINSNMDLHTTLNVFLNNVITELKVDAAAVLITRPHKPGNEFFVGYGFNTLKMKDDRLRSGMSLDRKVVRERKTLILNELDDQEVSAEFAAVWRAEDFKTYLGAPLIAKGQVLGVLEVYQRELFTPEPEWLSFFETLAGQGAIAIENIRMFDGLQVSNNELRLAYDATIEGWSRAMDLRDRETEGHTERVTEMTVHLAEVMKVSQEQLIHIRRGAMLHDIGKLGVPDGILFKPGPLSEDEWVVMRRHPKLAFDMLLPIDYLYPALDIPYCHHEKWDGTGYPRGLKGTQIPLSARMFTIIDVWDALRSDRPYRKAMSEEYTLNYIREQAGLAFEPALVAKFFDLLAENASISAPSE
ncbi:MAG: HD domain-containing phosphohydrolase [Anaerolineaceae bacterium]